MKLIASLLLGLALALPAHAQTRTQPTITTAAATVLAAAGAQGRSYLTLYNHGSVGVCCSFGATAVAATADFCLNGPGGNLILVKPQTIPGTLLSCITASSTAVLAISVIP